MAVFLIVAGVVYLIGGFFWFMITWLNYSVSREYRGILHTDAEIAEMARRVLRTPIWPFALLEMAGRTVAQLQRDVMRP